MSLFAKNRPGTPPGAEQVIILESKVPLDTAGKIRILGELPSGLPGVVGYIDEETAEYTIIRIWDLRTYEAISDGALCELERLKDYPDDVRILRFAVPN